MRCQDSCAVGAGFALRATHARRVAKRAQLSLDDRRHVAGPPSPQSQQHLTYDSARGELNGVRIHDLLHSFASRPIALGESLRMIGKLPGRRKVQTTPPPMRTWSGIT